MPSYNHNYETKCRFTVDGDIPVSKYESKKTGLKICICEVEGPLVMGYLTVATEALDDDGLPHTLEHLVFMGSESYPYKGVLDLLANRCLASGTNAFTAVDHTCYTMSTVGSEGFLNLLPIYLDHVLYPTLTDEAFVTEIHHVNGDGENAGVVYCEMQACENDGDNLCSLAMFRLMYPGVCGYKSETGGLMKNLRESTTNVKIRNYHKTYYRPDNLCIIITGKIDANDVFKAISPIEDKIIQKGPLPSFTRPWQSEIPPLLESTEQVVPFPCDDCENGMVYLAWRGPSVTEIGECTALALLFQYLSDTSVSPLQKHFVEIDDPYCTDVSASLNDNRITCLNMEFENVPKEKLYDIKNKLLEILSDIANGDEELDFVRMSTIIHNKRLDILNELEQFPHGTLSSLLICDFLYGETAKDLEVRLQQVQMIDSLAEEDASFWRGLIDKYYLKRNIVTIIGEPSTELKEKMMEEEKSRIAKQRESLGTAGLEKQENELLQAKKINEVKSPKGLVTSVCVPSVDSIQYHPIVRSCNYSNDAKSDDCLKNLPYCFQLDNIKTQFISMWVLMDTSILSLELRLFLPLFTELIMELPIMRNGKLVSYEEVVTELDADTLERATLMGIDSEDMFSCGEFSQLTGIRLKVEEEKYEKGIMWVDELLYKTKFTKDRIQVQVTKMINKVSKYKRNGHSIIYTLMDSLLYNKDSNSWSCSMLRQLHFLKSIQKLLNKKPKEVISKLETLRSKLTDPVNLVIHMASNLQNLGKDPLAAWQSIMKPSHQSTLSRHTIKKPGEFLKPIESSVALSSIAGIGSVETCYLVQSVRSIDNYNHPDLPSLMVLISYLIQLEGPLWCLIRGQGLAYQFSIIAAPTDGILYFILFKCTHLVAAYKETKKFIDNLLSGKEEWDESLLESCRSCLVFETIAERETTVSSVSYQSLLAYYKEIDMNYTRYLLSQIYKVTIEDLKRVGQTYLLPLFDTTKSSCGICCNTSKVEEIVAGFKTMSRDLTVITDIEDSFLASL